MRQLSFKRHRFPPDIIRHAIWLYARFTLSFRDVEEMLASEPVNDGPDWRDGDPMGPLGSSSNLIGEVIAARCCSSCSVPALSVNGQVNRQSSAVRQYLHNQGSTERENPGEPDGHLCLNEITAWNFIYHPCSS